jgi:hypothetical protein
MDVECADNLIFFFLKGENVCFNKHFGLFCYT